MLTKTLNPFHFLATVAAFFMLALAPATVAAPVAEPPQDTWEAMRFDLYGDRPILDGGDIMTLEAPYRAHDAATVPIGIIVRQGQDGPQAIKAITLVIDENPAPVAAVFTMGPRAGNAGIETRVRINNYSWVRAIAELQDGSLHMVRAYVKAAGGCSAPGLKDQDEALASLGKMKMLALADPAASADRNTAAQTSVRTAQIMIRHPNYSGLQMNQITRYYIPAHYVRDIAVTVDGEPVMTVEGAISLSEDPSIRFHYLGGPDSTIAVRAVDTEETVFENSWPVRSASGS